MTRLEKFKRSSIVNRIKAFIEAKEYKKLDSIKSVMCIMVLVVFYYTFIAADRYVSNVSLSVKATSGASVVPSGFASLMGSVSTSQEDLLHLMSYIESLDMLKRLDEKINLRSLYEKQKIDLFTRLYSSTSQEGYLKYYQDRVKVNLDSATGLLNVEVEGFTPKDAFVISTAVVEESESFINDVMHKISEEQLRFAESELEKARAKYENIKNKMLVFQNEYGTFDPKTQVEKKAIFITEIDLKISQKETELNAMLSYLNESAPQIIALKAEISALKQQLEKEQRKVASNISADKLNDIAAEYRSLSLDFAFTEDVYKAALKTVETTRLELSRKVKQLIVIQSPSMPEKATYPKKLYGIGTIFIILFLLSRTSQLVRTIIEEGRY